MDRFVHGLIVKAINSFQVDFLVTVRNSSHSGIVHSAAFLQTRHSLAFKGEGYLECNRDYVSTVR